MAELRPIVLIKEIPESIIAAGVPMAPIDLHTYFKSKDSTQPLLFRALLSNGDPLPTGITCSEAGIMSGTPTANTARVEPYRCAIDVRNNSKGFLSASFSLTIKPAGTDLTKQTEVASRLRVEALSTISHLKKTVWESLVQGLGPAVDLSDQLKMITPEQVYYLLQQFATVTVWDAYNLNPPGAATPVTLTGASEYFVVYDRGCCLVATPKDLFSHERTLKDAIRTAEAMAGEAYHRNWTVEMSGLDKLLSAVWVELQHLGDVYGKKPEVLHYDPTTDDLNRYKAKVQASAQPS